MTPMALWHNRIQFNSKIGLCLYLLMICTLLVCSPLLVLCYLLFLMGHWLIRGIDILACRILLWQIRRTY